MLILIVSILLIIYSTFSIGFVASILYKWFIFSYFVTYFPNLPEIGWIQFACFYLFLNSILPTPSVHLKKEYTTEGSEWFPFISPWLLLLIAWIFKIIFL
jgi:hypothetical protein